MTCKYCDGDGWMLRDKKPAPCYECNKPPANYLDDLSNGVFFWQYKGRRVAHGNPRYKYHLLKADRHTYACGFIMPDDVEVDTIRSRPTCPTCKSILANYEDFV